MLWEVGVYINMLNDYPTIAILGHMGAGKTELSTSIALLFDEYCNKNNLDFKVFANYTIDLERFKKVKVEDIIKYPDWLRNGILIIDEVHSEGGDSYNFLSIISKKLTTFFSQARKRNLAVIHISQNFGMVVKRIRDLTYYFIEVKRKKDNLTYVRIVGRDMFTIINEFEYDFTRAFNFFDTDEIISQEEENKLKQYQTELA